MKSTKKLSNSKLSALEEKGQKEKNKNENTDDPEEEEDSSVEESEKQTPRKKITNNNKQNENDNEKSKSIIKNEQNNNSQKNLDSNICTHNNTDNPTDNPEIQKHKRCVPLEIYTKVYQDKQTLINQVELLNKEITTLSSNSINEEMKILDTKYKNLLREKTSIENVLLNQEKYVSKLKKKIQKLESQIQKKKRRNCFKR